MYSPELVKERMKMVAAENCDGRLPPLERVIGISPGLLRYANIEVLYRFCEKYGCRPGYILGLEDEMY